MAICKTMESSQALKCSGKSETVISGAERGAHPSLFPVRLLSLMPGGREVVAAFLSPSPPVFSSGLMDTGQEESRWEEGSHMSRPVGRGACVCCASEMPEHCYSLIRNGFGLLRGPASEDRLLTMPRIQWLYHLWGFFPSLCPSESQSSTAIFLWTLCSFHRQWYWAGPPSPFPWQVSQARLLGNRQKLASQQTPWVCIAGAVPACTSLWTLR